MDTTTKPLTIGVIVGSTRPGRLSPAVGEWVARRMTSRAGRQVIVDVLDVADFELPLLDEPTPAAVGGYRHDHTDRWAQRVAACDGFVFVVPEYNRSFPAALKNAIDYLFVEWNDKAAGLVGFGLTGGASATDQLRTVLSEVKVACVRTRPGLALADDFTVDEETGTSTVTARPRQEALLERMSDELVEWATALHGAREVAAR